MAMARGLRTVGSGAKWLRLYAARGVSTYEQVIAASVVERPQRIWPDEEEWEREYREWAEPIREQHAQLLPDDPDGSKGGQSWEVLEFEPAPRKTPNDGLDGVKELERRLEQVVVLLVKDESGNWAFPKARAREGDTVRTAAERALEEAAGGGMEVQTIGNAPACHMEHGNGEATFYVRITYLDGAHSLPGDHAWVAKDELHHFLPSSESSLLARAL